MERSYNQFCPVAMAAEVLCSRWTVVLLRELLAGSTRFNDLRRGLPRMSPALLSQRLKELEETGIVERRPVPGEPTIHQLGHPAQQGLLYSDARSIIIRSTIPSRTAS